MIRALAVGGFLLAAVPGVARAQTPARAEAPLESARALIARFHEDPADIDRARDLLEDAVQRDPQPGGLTLLSRVYFLYGDLRARTEADKLAAYDRGRELGKRAVEQLPENPDAHLWYAINAGRWAQTKGVLRSLRLLPTMREEVETLLRLNPRSPETQSLAGSFFAEVPRLLGGDPARAEGHFKTGLQLDPHMTGIRLQLASFYLAAGRTAEARRELLRVLEEQAPKDLPRWTVMEVPLARKYLETIAQEK